MDVQSVGEFYQQLSKSNLHLLSQIYHNEVLFEDAAHRIEGFDALHKYFEALYENVRRCDFEIFEAQQTGDTGFLIWKMALEHPKLSKGNAVFVNGVSHLKFDQEKVIYQRDYFDMGEMIYENVPLLGGIIRTIKQRLGQ